MTPQLPGVPTGPLVGLALAAVAVNALSAYLAYRFSRSLADRAVERSRAAGCGRASGAPGSDPTVDCPECGTENESGYRYCRECVAELPWAIGVERTDSGPSGRLVG